ncbi:MAG: hypothetical protein ACP5SD_04330 [Elusimicrobiales bacterium]|nr:hypothetical protein [Elusimicrobiales bacterium]HOJ85830.1 hypothetical protein [Elusimicrobiales bacterium]
MKLIKKRKASLSATLLLCIAIITISTYVMKWVLDRHTITTRFHRSSVATTRTEGIFYNRISCCQYGSNCLSSVDGKSVTISGLDCNASVATGITFSINADN